MSYVSRIRISGVKCFSGPKAVELALDPEPGWTVLAGPNGSGKSALLASIALALGAYESEDPTRWLAVGEERGTVELPGLARWTVTAREATRTGRKSATYLTAAREIPTAVHPLLADIVPASIELSDGQAALASLVSALVQSQAETVLIDDIDTHLHPIWQQRIGSWLTTHFPHVQFIVSTHSPYVCQAADPGALIHLPATAPPQLLGEALHQRILYGSGDDTALSELFGLPSAYSPQAESERQLLIRLERKLYAGQASDSELDEYRKLGSKLNSSLSARADEIAARHLGRDR